jgi:transmembrane protein 132
MCASILSFIQVVQSCNLVYLDGSEKKGSPSVSVIAKYGRHTKFLFFRVWVPELPLEIELSDDKLSQIKGWKTPKQQRTWAMMSMMNYAH